jgi:exosome complex component RRP4
MAITILAPAPAAIPYQAEGSSDDSDDEGGVDIHGGDVGMRPAKRARHSKSIVTPGETVTDDPQWMRCVLS